MRDERVPVETRGLCLPSDNKMTMEQVDLIWGKAKVKALIRVLTPLLVNLRLGTCQFSILGSEMILV